MTEKKELKGMGGWLAFLVISMAILSPARAFFGYYRNIILTEEGFRLAGNPVWGAYKMIVLALVFISCALFFLAAYRLCRHHVWRSVRFAIMAMWVACTGMDVIGMSVLYFVFGGEFVSMFWDNGAAEVVKGMVYPAIWTLYLLRSARVRNTYRKETDIEELARHLGVEK